MSTDLDTVAVCSECHQPVEGSIVCPVCKKPLQFTHPLLLATVLRLDDLGYEVESWEWAEQGSWFKVFVYFKGFAPTGGPGKPTSITQLHSGPKAIATAQGKAWRDEAVSSKLVAGVFRSLYSWADEAKPFLQSIPFNRRFCELCQSQNESEWVFCTVRCPAGLDGFAYFQDGLPRNCPYVLEQKLTENDVKVSLGIVGQSVVSG